MEEKIACGQVYFALLDPVLGSEQGGCRPVVVVSNNIGNRHGPTVIVVPVTTGAKAQLPTHVALGGAAGLTERSLALCEQVRTIDKRRLGRRVGRMGAQSMALIDSALETAMALAEDAEVIVLCRKCAECFRDSGSFRFRRTDPDESAFYKTLITERGLKPNSIANVHVPLTQVFDYGVDSRILRYNPCHGVFRRIAAVFHRKKTGLPSSKKALRIEQEELFLDFLRSTEKNRRWYPAFAFMLKTGLRVGELTGLTLPDIDRDLKQIDVNHTLVYYNTEGYGCKGGSMYAINDTKTPAGMRILPMLDDVEDLLDEEIERQRADHIRSRMVIDGYRDFVFLNRFGDVLNEGTLNKALKQIIRDCNFEQMEKGSDLLLPNLSCHWLRHTFSTRMVESGLHNKARMYLMGHESLDTADTIYTDAQPEFLRREILKMAA